MTSDFVEEMDVPEIVLIDIEGIAVDAENTCISPDVTVLGQGPAEPLYYAPRCLRENDGHDLDRASRQCGRARRIRALSHRARGRLASLWSG